MTEALPLTRIIPWAHRALGEVLRPGAFAVDLTAGNGQDTLFLYRCVGARGRVVAFDIQAAAVESTAARLREAGAAVTVWHEGIPARDQPQQGVHLVCADHSDWGALVAEPPRAVVANLGYLPGASSPVATRPDSTLRALEHAFAVLEPGGRLAVVCYVGHPGGRREAESVAARFAGLDPASWRVLRVAVENHSEAPFLLVAEKRGAPHLATPRD